jgi:hypothetical protein
LVNLAGASFSCHRNFASHRALAAHGETEEAEMARGLLLWLLGVPIPVIILLWLFFGH